MLDPAEKLAMTPERYLALEATSAVKHELVRGEIFAMSGTSDAHNDVVSNVNGVLRAHLRGRPCRTHFESVKVRVEAADAFFYPDVFVTCDPRDREDPLVKRHPVLIVEVLSDSTADYDRGAKFADYRALESLREYVLIDSRAQVVEVFRKGDAGTWAFDPVESGVLTLASIGLETKVAALYDDTDVPVRRARTA
jgi:Uma2 family endonuclease